MLPDLPRLKPTHIGEKSAELKRMGLKHEALLNYMLANPTMKVSEVARACGVSYSWASIVVHSDAFQARLRQRQDEIFNAHVQPLHEKMVGVAHMAVDKLGEQLEKSTDPDYILNVSDKILHRLGFAPKATPVAIAPPSTTINQINIGGEVDATVLARAQEARRTVMGLMAQVDRQPTPELPPLDIPDLDAISVEVDQ